MQERFPAEFEAAFQRAYKTAPPAPAPCPWAGQFASQAPAWAAEFQAGAGAPASWADEFRPEGTVATWVDEFRSLQADGGDDAQLAQVARDLLTTLDMADPKLAGSRFVAFLRGLGGAETAAPAPCPFAGTAGTTRSDFELWKQQYRTNILGLADEDSAEWQALEKGWERYEARGLGYEGFAEREFSQYIFSLPPGANPHAAVADPAAAAHAYAAQGDLRSAILCCEAAVQRDAGDTAAWRLLGVLQQRNEMDVQAIAALRHASAQDPGALVGLAASCTNEACIPDALDALEAWVAHAAAPEPVPGIQSPTRIAGLIRELSTRLPGLHGASAQDGRVALSILFSIAGNHAQAAEALAAALAAAPASTELLNRMGALMANAQNYPAALALYAEALALAPHCPRVLYNRGISFMCSKHHAEAARAFVEALQHQLPVDVVQGVKPELVERYLAIWDTLRSNIEVSELPERERLLALCAARDLPALLRHLP